MSMKSVYQGVIVSAAAALAAALVLLAPVPMHGQLSEKDKAFKAKQLGLVPISWMPADVIAPVARLT